MLNVSLSFTFPLMRTLFVCILLLLFFFGSFSSVSMSLNYFSTSGLCPGDLLNMAFICPAFLH
jgi:hypothetical protein